MTAASINYRALGLKASSIFASLGILLYRSNHSWNTLRGDESLLLSDAINDGLSATVRSYAGYLHVVQRLAIWLTSRFSPELFPKVIYVMVLGFWLVNLALIGLALQRLTQNEIVWLFVPLATLLPPLGIEIVGDLAHIQIAMFLGISSVVVLSQLPASPLWLHLFGTYVFLFGVSSPSIALIAAWCFYRHEFPIVGSSRDEAPNRIVLRYSLVALLIQIWVTTVQGDREVEFSFDNFLEGLRFLLHSLLPQPYRDLYFDFDSQSNATLNSFFLFVVLAILILVVVRATRAFHDASPTARIAEATAFGLAASIFYTTISNSYHTGYLAALYVFGLLGLVWMVRIKRGLLRIGSALLLLTMLYGSFQSLVPNRDEDIFFGGSGVLYEELVPWDAALAEARTACQELPERDVFIATNQVDTFWGVTMSCEELD